MLRPIQWVRKRRKALKPFDFRRQAMALPHSPGYFRKHAGTFAVSWCSIRRFRLNPATRDVRDTLVLESDRMDADDGANDNDWPRQGIQASLSGE
jgi:hypothetical protein